MYDQIVYRSFTAAITAGSAQRELYLTASFSRADCGDLKQPLSFSLLFVLVPSGPLVFGQLHCGETF